MQRSLGILTAVAIAATTTIRPAAAIDTPAAGSQCPQIWKLFHVASTDRYGLVFRSAVATEADVSLRFFNGDTSYDLAAMPITIGTRTSAALVPNRSKTIVVRVPGPSHGVAVLATFDGNAGSCPVEGRRLPIRRYDELPASHAAAPVYDALQKDIDAETSTTTPLDVVADSAAPPHCGDVYVDPKAIKAISPEYPTSAKQQGITGTVQAIVDLDNAGVVRTVDVYRSSGSSALDEAAIRSAAISSYAPEIVACQPVGGTYVFRADFSAR